MAITGRRRIGNEGEDIACRFLESKGFRVVQRNYLKPWGELDIVALLDGVYRFVEVKTISRATSGSGSTGNMTAEDHVSPAKLRKLARTAELYMARVKGSPDYQIDVVTVELDRATRKARCKLYEQVL